MCHNRLGLAVTIKDVPKHQWQHAGWMTTNTNPTQPEHIVSTKTSTRFIMANSTWGAAVNWLDASKNKIHGHLTPAIQVGDEVVSQMSSGDDAVFKVTKVKHMTNPSDQFFADVEFVDYLKNLDF